MKTTLATLLALALATLSTSALAMIDFSNPLPTITAVVALVISFVNLYLSHIWGAHRTSCTLVAASYDGRQLTVHYTFENTGTFEEVVLGATFVFPDDEGRGYSTLTRKPNHDFLPELCDPFVLKPKQVCLQKYTWEVDADLLRTHFHLPPDAQSERAIEIKLDFVDPKIRRKASKRFDCATLKFYENFVTLSKTFSQQHDLFKGKADRI